MTSRRYLGLCSAVYIMHRARCVFVIEYFIIVSFNVCYLLGFCFSYSFYVVFKLCNIHFGWVPLCISSVHAYPTVLYIMTYIFMLNSKCTYYHIIIINILPLECLPRLNYYTSHCNHLLFYISILYIVIHINTLIITHDIIYLNKNKKIYIKYLFTTLFIYRIQVMTASLFMLYLLAHIYSHTQNIYIYKYIKKIAIAIIYPSNIIQKVYTIILFTFSFVQPDSDHDTHYIFYRYLLTSSITIHNKYLHIANTHTYMFSQMTNASQ